MPNGIRQENQRTTRPWYHDALSAFSFLILVAFLGKPVSRMLGPLAGLLFLAVTGGAAWYFCKSAWRSLTHDRANGGPR